MEKKLLLMFVLMLAIVSCATTRTHQVAPSAQVENDNYKIEVSALPVSMSGKYNGFRINVQNKTDSDLEIDWRRTVYLENEASSGGFIKGDRVRGYGRNIDRETPDTPELDIILPGTTFSARIIPKSKWGYSSSGASLLSEVMGGKTVVTGYPFQSGKHGTYLSLKLDGKNHREKIILDIP